MSTTSADRMRALRARQKAEELASVPEDEPGRIALALERSLGALDGPDEAMAETARALAATLDRSSTANPAVAAELRRTLDSMRAEQRRAQAEKGRAPANRPQSRLDELRRAAAQHPGRRGTRA